MPQRRKVVKNYPPTHFYHGYEQNFPVESPSWTNNQTVPTHSFYPMQDTALPPMIYENQEVNFSNNAANYIFGQGWMFGGGGQNEDGADSFFDPARQSTTC